jgi:AraC-like DNA-binding protein
MNVLIKNFSETIDSKIWGISVFSFGEMKVPAASPYPLQEFSNEHKGFWEKGRVLEHLFLVYISDGAGEVCFGDKAVEQIGAGTILILYPGIRHRYRPNLESGWTETWIGLKGRYVDFLLKNYKVFGSKQVIQLEDQINFENDVAQLKHILLEENLGYQIRAAGYVISILSKLYLLGKEEHDGTRIEKIIIEARTRIQNLAPHHPLDIRQLASDLNMSYSWFRKMYKHHTGCSPIQYRILLNIERASTLLIQTNLSVKEIAYNAGFESEGYFCRQFKQKQGMSPTAFRTRS